MEIKRDINILRGLKLESTAARDAVSRLVLQLETAQIQAEQKREFDERRRQHEQLQERRAGSQETQATGLGRWDLSRFSPHNDTEKVLLACHCFALDCGLVCLEEMKNSTPGFAAPLREVPASRFVSEAWHAGSTPEPEPAVRKLMYKHVASKKRFDVCAEQLPGAACVRVTLSERGAGGVRSSIEVPSAWCTPSDVGGESSGLFSNIADLESSFRGILPFKVGDDKVPFPAAQAPGMDVGDDGGRSIPVDTRVGAGDVFPQFQGPGGGMLPNPGAGSLVGPDHPLFGSGGASREPGYPGLPQPRFDPYGPVPGPNGPNFGGSGFLDPNDPGRGREPGGPDPDHLKPPDTPELDDPRQPPRFHFGRGGSAGRGRGGTRGGGFGFI